MITNFTFSWPWRFLSILLTEMWNYWKDQMALPIPRIVYISNVIRSKRNCTNGSGGCAGGPLRASWQWSGRCEIDLLDSLTAFWLHFCQQWPSSEWSILLLVMKAIFSPFYFFSFAFSIPFQVLYTEQIMHDQISCHIHRTHCF